MLFFEVVCYSHALNLSLWSFWNIYIYIGTWRERGINKKTSPSHLLTYNYLLVHSLISILLACIPRHLFHLGIFIYQTSFKSIIDYQSLTQLNSTHLRISTSKQLNRNANADARKNACSPYRYNISLLPTSSSHSSLRSCGGFRRYGRKIFHIMHHLAYSIDIYTSHITQLLTSNIIRKNKKQKSKPLPPLPQ